MGSLRVNGIELPSSSESCERSFELARIRVGFEVGGWIGDRSSFASSAGDKEMDGRRPPNDRECETGTENVPEGVAEHDVSIGMGPEIWMGALLLGEVLRGFTRDITENDRFPLVVFVGRATGSAPSGL